MRTLSLVRAETDLELKRQRIRVATFCCSFSLKVPCCDVRTHFLNFSLHSFLPGGPYRIVDLDGDGKADVSVDGGGSHTHATGQILDQFTWKEGTNTLANTEAATFSLPVGEHPVKLTVIDDAGNVADDETMIEVLPSWYPVVLSITPDTGSIAGNELVTITGSGFNFTAEEIVVHFGLIDLSGSDLFIKDRYTIELTTPATIVGAPVMVSVKTPVAVSNADLSYTYVAGVPIEFESGTLAALTGPTTVKFGPDRRLYVGHMNGKLTRIKFKEGGYTEVTDMVTATVANWRPVLGITFDPRDTSEYPAVYVSSNYFFHVSYRFRLLIYVLFATSIVPSLRFVRSVSSNNRAKSPTLLENQSTARFTSCRALTWKFPKWSLAVCPFRITITVSFLLEALVLLPALA